MPEAAATSTTVHERFSGVEHEKSSSAIEYAQQAERLALHRSGQEDDQPGATQTVVAKFVTPFDPVIEIEDGRRLPTVPVVEAAKLNRLKDELEGREPQPPPRSKIRRGKDGSAHGIGASAPTSPTVEHATDAPLRDARLPSRTNPLFPPLPMYGPPSTLRWLQSWFFRISSTVLSLGFLLTVVGGAVFSCIPKMLDTLSIRMCLQNPNKRRPFYEEEITRRQERRAAEKLWVRGRHSGTHTPEEGRTNRAHGDFVPTEGGPDPLCTDPSYYARREGLDIEIFKVQTEDGFILEMWHVFNPREYKSRPATARQARPPDVFTMDSNDPRFGQSQPLPKGEQKYPVLMIHGLLQSAGAFCCTGGDSFAFYLAKSGYDVWLGNMRCGANPQHTSLRYGDPRMWNWNIRQMGVMDLPALISRVLAETGFPKLALVAHSQGTTLTMVALAKEQRPDVGAKISVFCALAPAAYAGPLIGKVHFRFMKLISPAWFRLVFGIHAFIPLMMTARRVLAPRLYGWVGYHVFAFLFGWSDRLWDRGLRDRLYQWAPVYVSAESMRWWLGRECFAKHRCILSTREEGHLEDQEDEEDDAVIRELYVDREPHVSRRRKLQRNLSSTHRPADETRGKFAWYDEQFPPLALWVCGADDLVDGKRLLRRFDRGREPHVHLVHRSVIEGYEHLDIIWAMDAVEKVAKEIREVIWRTTDEASQARCRIPVGCQRPGDEDAEPLDDVPLVDSDGRQRMANIAGTGPNLAEIAEKGNPDDFTNESTTEMPK